MRLGWLLLLGFGALLAACGGGSDAPLEPPVTRQARATPSPSGAPTATATEQHEVTFAGTPTSEPRCPDPYPRGAPYQPEAGESIRLRPSGSPPALPAHRPMPFTVDRELEAVVRDSLGDEADRFSVVVKRLDDGRGARLNADRSHYAASLFKVWVSLEAYHQVEAGLLSLDERFVVSDYYGAFGLNPADLAVCEEVSVEEALGRMMRQSDNVAANLLLDRVGVANTNAALAALGLGGSSVAVDGSLPTTAADTALLLEAVARGAVVGPGSSQAMLSLLGSESIADRLPALLPAGTRVAHKTGSWENATHDAGIVSAPAGSYVIVVLSDYGFGEDGATPIARLSRAVYDHYNE